MNIENMLYIYDNIPSEVQKLNKELNDIIQNRKQTRDTLKATTITDMPRGGITSDPTYQAVEKIIDRYGERIKNITSRINWLLDSKDLIEEGYKVLSPEEIKIVDLWYTQKCKIDRMQYIMHYSRGRIYQIHGSAIKKLKDYTKLDKIRKQSDIMIACTFDE